jgi:hypothetical protein
MRFIFSHRFKFINENCFYEKEGLKNIPKRVEGLEGPIGKDRQDALESLIQPSVLLSVRK